MRIRDWGSDVCSSDLSALNHRLSRLPGGRYGGVFLMGMVSALIVGPCVAAPLAGVLLFISQTGDLLLGGTALFAMARGEGLVLLADRKSVVSGKSVSVSFELGGRRIMKKKNQS